MTAIVQWLEHSLVLPFLGTGVRKDIFQSCGHCWVFQICWHIDCSTLIASSFRILNSSAGISSLPLVLLEAPLPKAHFTSHSRMSGSEWETIPLWLSQSLISFFVQFFCVFFPSLLDLSCYIVRPKTMYCRISCIEHLQNMSIEKENINMLVFARNWEEREMEK